MQMIGEMLKIIHQVEFEENQDPSVVMEQALLKIIKAGETTLGRTSSLIDRLDRTEAQIRNRISSVKGNLRRAKGRVASPHCRDFHSCPRSNSTSEGPCCIHAPSTVWRGWVKKLRRKLKTHKVELNTFLKERSELISKGDLMQFLKTVDKKSLENASNNWPVLDEGWADRAQQIVDFWGGRIWNDPVPFKDGHWTLQNLPCYMQEAVQEGSQYEAAWNRCMDPPQDSEVLLALNSFAKGKAVGPDGFPLDILQWACTMEHKARGECIQFLGNYIRQVWKSGGKSSCGKGTRGALLPKVPHPSFNQYRPISIQDSISKVFDKLLETRVTDICDRAGYIEMEQQGFTKGGRLEFTIILIIKQ
jgi:hypothetical protein